MPEQKNSDTGSLKGNNIDKHGNEVGVRVKNLACCPHCIYQKSKDIQEMVVFSLEGEDTSTDLSLFSPNLIRIANSNYIQACVKHKARMEMLPKASKTFGIPPDQMDYLILDGKDKFKEEDLQRINKESDDRNDPFKFKIFSYKHQYTNHKGVEQSRDVQAIVFFMDKPDQKMTDIDKQSVLNRLQGKLPVAEKIEASAKKSQEPADFQEELLPVGNIEEIAITKLALKIKYNGEEYTFKNKVTLINNILDILKFGVKINPEDHSEIVFTDPKYIEQPGMAIEQKQKTLEEREKAIRSLIGIDKKITASDNAPKLEQALEKIGNDPKDMEIVRGVLSKELL